MTEKVLKTFKKALQITFPNGVMTAEQVVDAARPKNSVLHRFFEWNDTKAAEMWRLHQARVFICNITVLNEKSHDVREYIYVPTIKKYMETERARKIPNLWESVLKQALAEAISWKNRYEDYAQLEPITTAIDKVERSFYHGKRKERKAS